MLSLKLPKDLENRLNRLAAVTRRPKSYYMRQALEQYLNENEWQVEEIASAVQAADRPDAQFADHEQVAGWLESWGKKDEQEPPECA